ncbi:hypothetical protein MXB_3415 [Myxobolus squamalis]|nr:hypothetical protein MXB_3415 [Myxobolus squamalis]
MPKEVNIMAYDFILLKSQTKKPKLKKPYLHPIKEKSNKSKLPESKEESQYRDRAYMIKIHFKAKERREGHANEDLEFHQITQLANQSMNVISKVAIGYLCKNLYARDSGTPIDAGTSKYLGGDFEHTHLVKGLDYALLEKV